MVDPKTQSSVSYQSAYKYNLNNLSWTVQNIEGINNFGICGGLQSINDEAGRIFFYGGMQNLSGPICNKMGILYIKNMSLNTFKITSSRAIYTATLLKKWKYYLFWWSFNI